MVDELFDHLRSGAFSADLNQVPQETLGIVGGNAQPAGWVLGGGMPYHLMNEYAKVAGSSVNYSIAQNEAFLTPVVVLGGIEATKLVFTLNGVTDTVSYNFVLCADYGSSSYVPVIIYKSASVAIAAGGTSVQATLTQTSLPPGNYWFVFRNSGTITYNMLCWAPSNYSLTTMRKATGITSLPSEGNHIDLSPTTYATQITSKVPIGQIQGRVLGWSEDF